MRLLLDTHALIWAAQAPERLSERARNAIEDAANDVMVSAVSAMEIATKYRLGKLAVTARLAEHFVDEMSGRGFSFLPISPDHAQRGGLLAIPHRDPWDRILIAQTQMEGVYLVSNEQLFDQFAICRLW